MREVASGLSNDDLEQPARRAADQDCWSVRGCEVRCTSSRTDATRTGCDGYTPSLGMGILALVDLGDSLTDLEIYDEKRLGSK